VRTKIVFLKICCCLFISSSLLCCIPANEHINKPVLQVNNTTLTLLEYSELLSISLSKLDLMTVKNPKIKSIYENKILSEEIIKILIFEDLIKNQITISENEISSALKQLQEQYQSPLAFKEALASQSISKETLQKRLTEELKFKAFFQKLQSQIIPPTEADCLDFYNQKKSEYLTPEKIDLYQIVTKKKEQAEELLDHLKKKKSEFTQLAILDHLKQKKSEFTQLAIQFSIGPESVHNGHVGWIERGQVTYFDPAFNLKPNQFSSVIESPFGFHILMTNEKIKKRQLTFEQVKDKIFRLLIEEQEQGLFLKWLNETLRVSKIKKDDRLLKSVKITTEVTREN